MLIAPRKRFSQNFLQDKQIIARLVESINWEVGDQLVEIGPGLGALTAPLLARAGHLTAIELDRDLIPLLQQAMQGKGQLALHNADALQFDFSTLTHTPGSLRIVGNLPYQISTPLLFHLLKFITQIKDIHVMLQKEVVERMIASPHTKTYGRLSVMLQYHFAITRLFDVPASAFYPVPKVISAFVRLQPQSQVSLVQDYGLFGNIVRQAFNYRRKTLQNSLRDWIDGVTLERLEISPLARAEQLSVQDFVRITNTIYTQRRIY